MRLAILAEREPQRLLGPGLADRTGDADHLGRGAGARRGGKIAQRGEHIRHQQERRAARHCAAAIGGDDGQRGIGLERPRDEFMPVALIAFNGEERIAGGDCAAVDRNAGDRLRRALALGAASRQPSRRPSTAGAPSCGKLLERRGDRLVIAERHHPVADDLAGFMALAGDQQHVAGAQRGDGRADRLAPVADLDGAGRCRHDGGADRRRRPRCADCRR